MGRPKSGDGGVRKSLRGRLRGKGFAISSLGALPVVALYGRVENPGFFSVLQVCVGSLAPGKGGLGIAGVSGEVSLFSWSCGFACFF